jgi:RNA recognition motif-containing protein
MANTDQTPSHTLYVNNLNEKIKKDVLKKSILSVFSQFGKVIDIVACRGIRLRGQVSLCYVHEEMVCRAGA